MVRSRESGLHYTVDGQDQGVIIDSVFVVIDLFGVFAEASSLQCSAVQCSAVHRGAGGNVARYLSLSVIQLSSVHTCVLQFCKLVTCPEALLC